jgi:nitroreductase
LELESAILTRRSARKFKSEPVPEEIIEEMLRMAQAAPSGGNGQSHVFGVIRDAQTKEALAEAAGGQMWIAGAPLVVACCSRLETELDSDPEDDFTSIVNRLRWGADFWEYLLRYKDRRAVSTLLANASPLIPAEHMFLTAVSHGLSACFIGWLDVARASAILGLPDDIRCLFLLPVGYPAEEPKPIGRKGIDEIAFWDAYGK